MASRNTGNANRRSRRRMRLKKTRGAFLDLVGFAALTATAVILLRPNLVNNAFANPNHEQNLDSFIGQFQPERIDESILLNQIDSQTDLESNNLYRPRF
ncbi:MAG: hypothetical protein R3C03_08730 [Pirellulaceae bacterium]